MIRALYLHVPFCASRCRYCDFATAACRAGDPAMGSYATALARLADQARSLGLTEGLATAYVGGGTPSLLGERDLARLVRAAAEAGARPLRELSFEANPESLGPASLAAAADAGATRVSIGVQSFDDRELAALGRLHSAQRAREAVAAAVDSGLSTSVDLMCGIPHQTPASWERSLKSAVSLGVAHMSCYPLAIEEGTAMERLCETGRLPWPDDDASALAMDGARRVLGRAGLSRYEVASYARPGAACEHNIAYWTGVEYLGLGTAAASMLSRGGYEALRAAVPGLPPGAPGACRFRLTVASDTAAIARASSLADLAFDVEELNAREAAAEDLMLGLRMTAGADPATIRRARAAIPAAALEDAIAWAVETGLAAWGPEEGGALVPTERGWLMGNELYGRIWDLARDG